MNDNSHIQKGELLFEGKTKKGWEVKGLPNLVIMESKPDITAHDDPRLTKQFGTKAQCATSTTCRMFELLKLAGIPTAFMHQLSENEFLAERAKMIRMEVVARRLAGGSFTKRHPEMVRQDNEPYRFSRLYTEFFLKTSGGKLIIDGETVIEGLDPQKGQEDPLIANPRTDVWQLLHAKRPLGHPECDLGCTIPRNKVDKDHSLIQPMNEVLRKVFLALEGAWNTLGLRLVDIKIEFGNTADGELVVADVIDNDSWRLRDKDRTGLNKQRFLDGDELSAVEEIYQLVARLTERIRIPRQAIVLWRGSKKDNFPETPGLPASINRIEVTFSGHKQPIACLRRLEELQRDFPDSGVILAIAGRSNGLGPMLAAHTTWPVISVPPGIKDFPENIWSSLQMPRDVPNATILDLDNAFSYALNILSVKNPIIYMGQRFAIEERMES